MKRYSIESTVDRRWMVLVDGLQWGKGPRDKSGASGETWATRKEAIEAIEGESPPPPANR